MTDIVGIIEGIAFLIMAAVILWQEGSIKAFKNENKKLIATKEKLEIQLRMWRGTKGTHDD